MPIDNSELRNFGRELGIAPTKAAPLVRAVIVKGAVNIKETMRKEMSKSRSLGHAAQDIDFDVINERDGVAAEIGPVVGRGKGHAGGLAWIAYQGSATSGPSVRDPQEDLDQEAPNVERELGDILESLL